MSKKKPTRKPREWKAWAVLDEDGGLASCPMFSPLDRNLQYVVAKTKNAARSAVYPMQRDRVIRVRIVEDVP